jgi:hypothetical protein
MRTTTCTSDRAARGRDRAGNVSMLAYKQRGGPYVVEFTAPRLPAPVVLTSVFEVAMALHLSGQKLHPRMTRREIADAAVQGIADAGPDRIHRACNAVMAAVGNPGRRSPWTPSREQLCIQLADEIAGKPLVPYRKVGGRDRPLHIDLDAR